MLMSRDDTRKWWWEGSFVVDVGSFSGEQKSPLRINTVHLINLLRINPKSNSMFLLNYLLHTLNFTYMFYTMVLATRVHANYKRDQH